MFNFIKSKKFLLALAGITVITLIFSLVKPRLVVPTLLKSIPPNNSNNISTIKPITLEFEGVVISSDFAIVSSPEHSFDIKQIDNYSLSVVPTKQLTPEIKYSLSVVWKNNPLTTLIFTTQHTETDYELLKNVKAEIAKNYPLATLMPYETSNYKVLYSGPLTLEITSKNPNLKSQELIDSVKSWVIQNGADASAHKYVIAP